ncbi:MAG: hypothetical protein R2795_23575 [Saprospiraceae bacterium]
MDRNQLIGILLIFGLLMVWQQFFAPTPEELQAEQHRQDSIAMVSAQEEMAKESMAALDSSSQQAVAEQPSLPDSLLLLQRSGGVWRICPSYFRRGIATTLSNDLMEVVFSLREVLFRK